MMGYIPAYQYLGRNKDGTEMAQKTNEQVVK